MTTRTLRETSRSPVACVVAWFTWTTDAVAPVGNFRGITCSTSLSTAKFSRSQHSVLTSQEWVEFHQLLARWHAERGTTSSITTMAMCPSYQRIIGMGQRAVPLILQELEAHIDDPDHWFWALQAITGTDPVPEEARGDTRAMAQFWLGWARLHYDW